MALPRSPHRDRLLDTVHDIAPRLEAGAMEAEQQRHLGHKAVNLLRQTDLFRCAAAEDVGGLGIDPLTQLEVFEAVTAAESAAGWNLMISAILAQVVGSRVADDAAHEIFGSGEFPIFAGLVWPRGRAVTTEGGYSLTGRWPFCSGIHQADWVLGGAMCFDGDKQLTNPDGTPSSCLAVLRKRDVDVHDTWHVTGLRGTGSADFSVTDAFVPESCAFGPFEPATTRGTPWTRLPGPLVSGTGHGGFALGVGQRMLQELKTTIAATSRSMTDTTLGDRESFQLGLGRLMVRFDAARTLVFDSHLNLWTSAMNDAYPQKADVDRMRTSIIHATELAVEIAQFAFRAAGTVALSETSPIQRYLRDILAAQQHAYVRDSGYVDLAVQAIGNDR
ncbi:MAG: hypothetical protein KDI19_00210 [Pseudomonadales bacterium]|nr:hypothetical protein [Pseudomonadales bacterium]